MKYFLLLVTVLGGLTQSHAQTNPKTEIHKVIFQMSTANAEEQEGLISNLESLKKGWGDNILIEVVAHGPGITFLMKDKSAVAEGIAKMLKEGVIFVACENTMHKKNITKEQLIEGAGTVPMGIGEIILKQEQGWSYIKGNF